MKPTLALIAGLLSLMSAAIVTPAATSKPNIVIILADDLGYGDVQCYNPERGKIPTPNIDRLAKQGMRFTDAHTSSGVCSPTRYALLTGRYHWRSRLQAGIVGYLEKPLIAPNRLTLASMLKQQGYRTGMAGKWHLGWDWNIPAGERPLFAPTKGRDIDVTDAHRDAWKRVYGAPIGGGPLAAGFDEYFGTDVPNWPPYTFIENNRVTKIPDAFLPQDLLKATLASLPGPAVTGWKLEDILPAVADRACSFIEKCAKQPAPFFLYLPLTAPHTPIAVSEAWKGKSGLNNYADFVMETDAAVGQVLSALEKSGVAEKTLVVFTSDNGCSPLAQIPQLQSMGHYPSGPLRGQKFDVWEGGHRVPFIIRWPGTVKPGAICGQLVHQADLMATFAEVVGATIPVTAGEDSVSLISLIKGGQEPVREYAISHAGSGLPSLRKGNWKIIFGKGGGNPRAGADPADEASGQLYDLAADIGEKKNLWNENPGLVAELMATMKTMVDRGRSTPGANQTNDVPVRWEKFMNLPDAPKAAASTPGKKKKKQ